MLSPSSARNQALTDAFDKAKLSIIEKFSFENIKEIFPESLTSPSVDSSVLEEAHVRARTILSDKLTSMWNETMVKNQVEDALSVLDAVIDHSELLDPSFEVPPFPSSTENILDDELRTRRNNQLNFLIRLRSILKQETAEEIQRAVNVAHHVSEIENLDLTIRDLNQQNEELLQSISKVQQELASKGEHIVAFQKKWQKAPPYY
ncbi:hypothetical protein MDAP_002532 [Mitosporidium daphniae]